MVVVHILLNLVIVQQLLRLINYLNPNGQWTQVVSNQNRIGMLLTKQEYLEQTSYYQECY